MTRQGSVERISSLVVCGGVASDKGLQPLACGSETHQPHKLEGAVAHDGEVLPHTTTAPPQTTPGQNASPDICASTSSSRDHSPKPLFTGCLPTPSLPGQWASVARHLPAGCSTGSAK
jgi:hypothetical protein